MSTVKVAFEIYLYVFLSVFGTDKVLLMPSTKWGATIATIVTVFHKKMLLHCHLPSPSPFQIHVHFTNVSPYCSGMLEALPEQGRSTAVSAPNEAGHTLFQEACRYHALVRAYQCRDGNIITNYTVFMEFVWVGEFL